MEEGEVSEEELKQNFFDMWKTNWPWQVRQLEDKQFLIRFPQNKRIEELLEYSSINLKKRVFLYLLRCGKEKN